MPIPDYQTPMLPVLRLTEDGNEYPVAGIRSQIANVFNSHTGRLIAETEKRHHAPRKPGGVGNCLSEQSAAAYANRQRRL